MQLVDDELDAFLTGKTPGHQPEKPENGNIYISFTIYTELLTVLKINLWTKNS